MANGKCSSFVMPHESEVAEHDADDAADAGQRAGLDQHLRSRSWRRAPTAMRTPISRVRSVTEISMMFITPMPPTISPIDDSTTSTSATAWVTLSTSSP